MKHTTISQGEALDCSIVNETCTTYSLRKDITVTITEDLIGIHATYQHGGFEFKGIKYSIEEAINSLKRNIVKSFVQLKDDADADMLAKENRPKYEHLVALVDATESEYDVFAGSHPK